MTEYDEQRQTTPDQLSPETVSQAQPGFILSSTKAEYAISTVATRLCHNSPEACRNHSKFLALFIGLAVPFDLILAGLSSLLNAAASVFSLGALPCPIPIHSSFGNLILGRSKESPRSGAELLPGWPSASSDKASCSTTSLLASRRIFVILR